MGLESTQVQLHDYVDDEACQMVRRQTFAQRDGGIEGGFVIRGFEFSAHVPSVDASQPAVKEFSPTGCYERIFCFFSALGFLAQSADGLVF